ncbi:MULTISPECIES: hypothetical protein [unclassified Pseudomonas]|uniref:hypothetical protein n=1 Tax=unclassified Pseudomonas TaxID=196821 RepID=UPI0011F02C50|nr:MULTISPECIES: hypothetical protein [unclassified Pseudomonas]KAA0949553.1 hypothetical protein FQ182_03205 [Pseudomonas sp. ANT_H4]KAA0954433.1 hypothetical protein FQ186_00620 [Pseudomonas sp. ANT_H14]
MSIFQRFVLLIKVLVLLCLGMSTAWAHNPVHGGNGGFSAVQNEQGSGLQLAKSESEGGDQGQGGSADDDDTTTEEPDTDDSYEGDSQT